MKFKDTEEAKEALASAKEERDVASNELKAFKKENGIKGDEAPKDEKTAKKLAKMTDLLTKKRENVEGIKSWLSENKPKKEPKIRETKYQYPDDCKTALDKKKFRASERARLKREAKEASGEGKKKDKKKEEKAEKKEGGGKKDKKKEKKEKGAETED